MDKISALGELFLSQWSSKLYILSCWIKHNMGLNFEGKKEIFGDYNNATQFGPRLHVGCIF